MSQILKMEEEREKANLTHARHGQIVKKYFDANFFSPKNFQIGDLVLKWDKAHEEKVKHTKFQRIWLGPFQIIEQIGPSTFMLQDLHGRKYFLLVNGLISKNFFS